MQTTVGPESHLAFRQGDFDALRRAIGRVVAKETGRETATLSIGVSGGAPTERYTYWVSLNGSGSGQYEVLDEKDSVGEELEVFNVSADDAARVFELLDGFVEPSRRELYDPDSLVGFVSIHAGEVVSETYFPVWDKEDFGNDGNPVDLPVICGALVIDARKTPHGITPLFQEVKSLVSRSSRSPSVYA